MVLCRVQKIVQSQLMAKENVMSQARFFLQDTNRIIGKKKYRLLYIWINRNFAGILLYRLERSLFLLIGNPYKYVRILFLPIFKLLQWYSNMDIHYEADLKGGLIVLHPSVGCVISKFSNVGVNLTLTGGNIIGVKKKCDNNEFIIGDNCTLGANATIIGPLNLGNNIIIGASSSVVSSFKENDIVLGGVPAKVLKNVGSQYSRI